MSGLKYRDQFWGDKHHGYHTLYERFKAGDEAVYELEMLIKEHSAMQEDQLRALAKTLGKVTNFASSGTSQMVEAWSLTKSTLELLQEIQMASFKSLQEQSRELARYRAELAHSKKRVKEGECVEAVSLMQTTTTCLQKAKETYMARCAELDKLRADQTASAKEINKAEQKLGRARDEYRAYTDKYEMVRADFEERMEKSADAFEAHDLSHLSTLKAAFVAFATAQQEQSEAMANVQTQFRESLATISVQALMDRFCSECSTGGERPPHMPFESLEGGGGAASSSAAAVQQPQPYILLSPSAAANAAAAAAAAGDNQSVGSSGKVGGGAAPAQIVDLLSDDPLPVQLQPLQQQQPVQLQPPVREEDVVLEEIDREETGRKEEDERREERKEGENEEKKESEEKKVLKREEWVEDWNLTSPRSKGEITGWEALREEAAEGRERFEKAKGLRGKKEEDERREDLKEGEKREGENEEKKVLKREEWVEDWNLTSPRSKGEVSGMEALREVLNEEKSAGGKERFEKAKGVRGRKDEKETPLSSSMSASFSASLGGSRQKLAMWLPGKRKKTSSVCSTDVAAVEGGTEGVASSSGGGGFLNKFGRSRRSNKSKTDLPGAVAGEGGVGFDDAHSTASSSRSEDKPSCLLTHSLEPTQPTVDEEGFTIRGKEDDDAGADEAKWASCSSDEDDEEDEERAATVQQLQRLQREGPDDVIDEPKLRPKRAKKKYSRIKKAIERRTAEGGEKGGGGVREEEEERRGRGDGEEEGGREVEDEGRGEGKGVEGEGCIHSATEQQEAAVAALLQRLQQLHDRAHKENPTRARAHRRLLLGLNQVEKEVERCSLIVVAGDVDEELKRDRKWRRIEEEGKRRGGEGEGGEGREDGEEGGRPLRIVQLKRTRREMGKLLKVRGNAAVAVVGVRWSEGAKEEERKVREAMGEVEELEKEENEDEEVKEKEEL